MSEKANFRALLPMIVFLVLFIGTGIALTAAGADMPFYQLSATVAIIPAIVLAILQGKDDLNKKIGVFLSGVGEINIITMCMIFLLAGGFASVASAIGGVKATVNFGLSLLPPSMILPGLFLIGAFISTAMGTSMGTVAAIAPIAVGVGEQTDIPLALLLGVVMSGAMFGDNLSMISDTTIAATRTQGCEMKDKFRMNLLIAVLEKRAGYFFGNLDVYINIVSGITLRDTACDLAVCLSMVSSLLDCPVSDKLIAIGEVGLGGEVRSVPNLEQRLREAERIGFERAVVPKHSLAHLNAADYPGMKLVGAAYISDAIHALKSDRL